MIYYIYDLHKQLKYLRKNKEESKDNIAAQTLPIHTFAIIIMLIMSLCMLPNK